jgi:hypothetical protein
MVVFPIIKNSGHFRTLVVTSGHGSIVPSRRQESREIQLRNPNDPFDSVSNKELVGDPAPHGSGRDV